MVGRASLRSLPWVAPAASKMRIVLEGLRGEENISELCRREGIAEPPAFDLAFRTQDIARTHWGQPAHAASNPDDRMITERATFDQQPHCN